MLMDLSVLTRTSIHVIHTNVSDSGMLNSAENSIFFCADIMFGNYFFLFIIIIQRRYCIRWSSRLRWIPFFDVRVWESFHVLISNNNETKKMKMKIPSCSFRRMRGGVEGKMRIGSFEFSMLCWKLCVADLCTISGHGVIDRSSVIILS